MINSNEPVKVDLLQKLANQSMLNGTFLIEMVNNSFSETKESWLFEKTSKVLIKKKRYGQFLLDFAKWPMIGHFETEFPYLLGSTNPYPIAVHMEPFSTSVFEVLIWIFATTTKICTRGRFTQAHAKGFTTTPTLPYSSELRCLLWRLSIGTTIERYPFSGLVDLAGVLLHTL